MGVRLEVQGSPLRPSPALTPRWSQWVLGQVDDGLEAPRGPSPSRLRYVNRATPLARLGLSVCICRRGRSGPAWDKSKETGDSSSLPMSPLPVGRPTSQAWINAPQPCTPGDLCPLRAPRHHTRC